jgi:hypothetical protein
VDWWTRDTVTAQMAETFAVRVLDALDSREPAIRIHDGQCVLADDKASR